MAKSKLKAWPNQYLVVCRTNLDELPLLLTPDRREAYTYAKAVPESDIDKSARFMGVDSAGRVNVAVISFRRGKPYRMDLVADLLDGGT